MLLGLSTRSDAGKGGICCACGGQGDEHTYKTRSSGLLTDGGCSASEDAIGVVARRENSEAISLRDNFTSSGLSLLGSIADQGICSDVGKSSEGCSLIEVVGPVHLF